MDNFNYTNYVVNIIRAVSGHCPWSHNLLVRIQTNGWCHGKLPFFVLFNMVCGFKMFARLFQCKQVKASKKGLQKLVTKRNNGETKRNRVLDDLKMPKLKQIFMTVAIVCHWYERPTVLKLWRQWKTSQANCLQYNKEEKKM